MSDRRQYKTGPVPAQVDSAWLRHELQRLSQSLALIDEALNALGTSGEDALTSIETIEGWAAADITSENISNWNGALEDIEAIEGWPASGITSENISNWNDTLDNVSSWNGALEDIEAIEGWPAAGATAEDFEGWDDLRFPAQAINPAGAADAPSVDNVLTSFPGTLLFSGSIENVICGIAQMPHAWKKGSTIRPHIHWSKPTGSSSAVSWEFYYRHCGMAGETPGSWVGPISGTLGYGDQTVTNQHLITSFGDVSMTGKKESSIINWQIRRLGHTDADNNAVRLIEFDIHYELDKRGTTNEIPS